MYQLLETLKTNILFNFRTDNVIIDMIVSMIVISIITYLMNERLILLEKIKILYNKLMKKRHNRVEITFTAKEYGASGFSGAQTDYPRAYLAILYHIDQLNAKTSGICALKQIDKLNNIQNRFDRDKDIDNALNTYTINQDNMFQIEDYIYCQIENNINEEKKNNGEGSNENRRSTKLHILTIFSNIQDMKYLKNFVEKCCWEYEKYIKEINEKVQFYETYVSTDKEGHQTFDEYIFTTNRTLDNIYFDEKLSIIERIDFFIHNKKWYDARGIPYTLGLMLYGEPGCGKTSFIKALCNMTKRHIIDIPLSRVKSCRELQNVFHKLRINNKEMPFEKRIYIFEDIDCVSDIIESRESKDKKMKEFMKKFSTVSSSTSTSSSTDSSSSSYTSERDDKITLSYILNLIDGILETPGRILIITTNYPEKLDKALIRPGRIDIKIEFIKATTKVIAEMLTDFYETTLSKNDIQLLDKADKKWTPAELIQICGKNLKSISNAIIDITKYN